MKKYVKQDGGKRVFITEDGTEVSFDKAKDKKEKKEEKEKDYKEDRE